MDFVQTNFLMKVTENFTEQSGMVMPGLRSNSLVENQELFCDWVVVVKAGAHNVLRDLEARLHRVGLYTSIQDEEDLKLTFIKIFAPFTVLEICAERCHIPTFNHKIY